MMFLDAAATPGTTNAVAAVTDVAAQVTEVVGRHVDEGRELARQALGWLTQNGVTFALNALAAALILVAGGLVVKGLVAALRRALGRSKRVDALLRTFLCSIASKTGWTILAVIALGRLGVDVGPLVASLGVTGVVLGFAFKESLGSLAAGLMIALNHPFKVGDYVIVGGIEGAVAELNMMATVLTTGDNKKVTVPNGTVWGSAITNFNALGVRRVDLQVGVAYGADLAAAQAAALEAVRAVPGVLADPAPAVAVAALAPPAVLLNVRPWATCADYWAVRAAVQAALVAAFGAAGVSMPVPRLDVALEGEERLRARDSS